MSNILYIIGNGFDLAHELPTNFDPDFKIIAERNENNREFWNLYQTAKSNIWSDFEYCLGRPDYNSLETIFCNHYPDYQSDRESDRDGIITEVDISGNLGKSLLEFAKIADEEVYSKIPLEKYYTKFDNNDLFITFNYTHTLEQLYSINSTNILHIHGEVGKDNLLLGYPKGVYCPEKYRYDATCEGHYVDVDFNDYIERIDDYYIRTAYKKLVDKCKSFSKQFQKSKIDSFLTGKTISKIEIIGHSCKIDFEYFEYLNEKYPNLRWTFNPFSPDDRRNVEELIKRLRIVNYKIDYFK